MARIISTTPSSFATGVSRNVFLKAQFDVDLNRSTVTDLTIFLIRTSDQKTIPGVADYILGTRMVTFQLQELLDSNTEYTWILVGRAEGLKTLQGTAALGTNEQVTFKTGTTIDPGLPLAGPNTVPEDIPAFQGGAGVYDVVFGKTGEPISHVVTTAGSIGPSGTIIPAPAGSAVYLALSGSVDPDPIEVSGTFPENGDHFLIADDLTDITVSFSDIPVNTGLTNGGINILVEDILDLDATQPTWTTTVVNNTIVVTPSAWRPASKYTVTVDEQVRGENSTYLGEDYVFSFTVKPIHFYTTVKMVRINLQAAISKITDEQIELLIYENSLWALEHSEVGFDEEDPPLYVRDFVLCKTKLDAMNLALMGGNTVTGERIGDVEFKYGSDISGRFKEKLDEIKNCVEKNKIEILGSTKTIMQTAVKAGQFPGRPGRSTTWTRIGRDGGFEAGRNAPGA